MEKDLRSKLDQTLQEHAARLKEKELQLSREATKFAEVAEKLKQHRDRLKRKSKELRSKEQQLNQMDQKYPDLPRPKPESKHDQPQAGGLPPVIHKIEGFSDQTQALSLADLRFPPTTNGTSPPPQQLPATFNLATTVPRTMTISEIPHHYPLPPQRRRPIDLPPLEDLEPTRPETFPSSLPRTSKSPEPTAPRKSQQSLDHLDERRYQLLHMLLQKSSSS